MAKLAFYKGRYGNIWDKFICLVTRSKYSHVELVYGQRGSIYKCWSSSTYDGGVRLKWMHLDDKWDIINIPDQVSEKLFIQENRKEYDYIGLLGTVIKHQIFSRRRKWFCSEIVAEALGLKDSWKYTPEDLYKMYG